MYWVTLEGNPQKAAAWIPFAKRKAASEDRFLVEGAIKRYSLKGVHIRIQREQDRFRIHIKAEGGGTIYEFYFMGNAESGAGSFIQVQLAGFVEGKDGYKPSTEAGVRDGHYYDGGASDPGSTRSNQGATFRFGPSGDHPDKLESGSGLSGLFSQGYAGDSGPSQDWINSFGANGVGGNGPNSTVGADQVPRFLRNIPVASGTPIFQFSRSATSIFAGGRPEETVYITGDGKVTDSTGKPLDGVEPNLASPGWVGGGIEGLSQFSTYGGATASTGGLDGYNGMFMWDELPDGEGAADDGGYAGTIYAGNNVGEGNNNGGGGAKTKANTPNATAPYTTDPRGMTALGPDTPMHYKNRRILPDTGVVTHNRCVVGEREAFPSGLRDTKTIWATGPRSRQVIAGGVTYDIPPDFSTCCVAVRAPVSFGEDTTPVLVLFDSQTIPGQNSARAYVPESGKYITIPLPSWAAASEEADVKVDWIYPGVPRFNFPAWDSPWYNTTNR